LDKIIFCKDIICNFLNFVYIFLSARIAGSIE